MEDCAVGFASAKVVMQKLPIRASRSSQVGIVQRHYFGFDVQAVEKNAGGEPSKAGTLKHEYPVKTGMRKS